MSRFVLTLALLAGFAMITPAHAALNACASAKKQCVAKKTAAILKCHAMNEKPPGISLVKFQACVQKAKDKFDGGANPAKGCFAKLEAKFPGGCLTTLDVANLEATVDAFVDDVICQLDPSEGTCPVPTPTLTPTPTVTPTPPAPPTCNDALQNGGETGVDCGGPCPGCPLGGGCGSASDCVNAICSAGQCVCGAGQSDCNNIAGDGCEVNTTNDTSNCGACGNFCNIPNATQSCVGGQCGFVSCLLGYGNCNITLADGCESDTQNDPNNCGICGIFCPPFAPNCSGGSCMP